VNVPFADKQITELTCHAKGVAALFPEVKTAIDIGGQDAKVLKIKNGRLVDFLTNDKCAAGTGRFLEVAAETLGLELNEMGNISLQTDTPVKINSLCTIFAQQEIISRLSAGEPLPIYWRECISPSPRAWSSWPASSKWRRRWSSRAACQERRHG
jgi:predicted CoA-substrate-specific enzyme activase